MLEAEVTRAPEALGQDVAQEQRDEVRAGLGAITVLAGFAVAVTEGDLAVLASDDMLFEQDAAVEIAGQIDERLFAGVGGLTVDNTSVRVALGLGQVRVGERLQQFGTEDLRQGLVREQVGSFARGALGSPALGLGIDGAGRDDEMDVWVEVEAA
jgi:hypothetical protein